MRNLLSKDTIYKCNIEKSPLQFLELKHLAEMEHDYKRQCHAAIRSYKVWRVRQKLEEDIITLLYGNLEGIILRRHAEEAIKAYWIIRTDFRKGFRQYIQNLSGSYS